ncbi:helix-turn-helix transcriptional regulator [Candidatus Williamhamiltonella defendens]|uniref:helix-turn-helix transcriptional regulator n=1 Tax=Candidatus Williamhamiltonella defendens TaxID=138072 RepID=UPI002A4E21AB|nr:LuxR C-terminal-related transcriptional regulator [Candidatus Hamiltonella defensa]
MFLTFNPNPPENVFTEKELEVIFCVLQNMSSKLIALHLGLSHRTVKINYRSFIVKQGLTLYLSSVSTAVIKVTITIFHKNS